MILKKTHSICGTVKTKRNHPRQEHSYHWSEMFFQAASNHHGIEKMMLVYYTLMIIENFPKFFSQWNLSGPRVFLWWTLKRYWWISNVAHAYGIVLGWVVKIGTKEVGVSYRICFKRNISYFKHLFIVKWLNFMSFTMALAQA